MSDIEYDTRTGAVMAGGMSGSGQKAGAIVKQQLAQIRATCSQAKSKSNQDLILLLQNYNDQVESVIEALKTGDAEKTTGGWETTVSKKGKGGGKGKKVSESETGNGQADSGSVTRNTAAKLPPSVHSNDNDKSKKDAPPKEKGRQSNGDGKSKPTPPPPSSSNGQDKKKKNEEQDTLPPVKDVAIPDMQTHKESLQRLSSQFSQMHTADLHSLDSAAHQLRQALEERYQTLRRALETNYLDGQRTLETRVRQSEELSDRVGQSGNLSPEEYAKCQQDITAFTGDYKLDLHLASTAKFIPSTEATLKALNKSGHVASVVPAYSYLPASVQALQHRPSENASSQRAPGNAPSKSGGGTAKQQSHQPEQQQQQNQQQHQQRNKLPNRQQQQEQQQTVPQYVKQDFSHERVTIVPKDSLPNAAPLGSLVISGGNLTAEEMAALTLSLENSLRYKSSSSASSAPGGQRMPVKPIGSALENAGDSFPTKDIFSGGAIWTNSSNSAFETGQWTSEESHAAEALRPIGQPRTAPDANHNEHPASYGAQNGAGGSAGYRGGPRRGGPGSARGGQLNGRGAGGRGGSQGGRGGGGPRAAGSSSFGASGTSTHSSQAQ